MILSEISGSSMPIIAVYVGRFHPMGMHHYLTYVAASRIFGANDTYIVTSDTVKLPKSPLNFAEKEKIAIAHGVPEDKIVFCRSGYQPLELHQKIQRERKISDDEYAIVFIVGDKDMREDPRFSSLGGMTKPTKRNPVPRPRYMRMFPSDIRDLQPASKHGYVYTVPHVSYRLPNGDESSGTNLRNFLYASTPEQFEEAMGFFDQEIYDLLKDKFDPANLHGVSTLTEAKRSRSKLFHGQQAYSDYLEEIMSELQFIKKSYESTRKSGYRYRKEASKLQDAYSELRRLKRKNDKLLLAKSLNEHYSLGYSNVKISHEGDINREETRDFIRTFKP